MKYLSIIIILIGFIGGWLAEQRRKKKGLHDEVYVRNSQKAKAYAWHTTLAITIIFMWMFTFLDLSMSAYTVIIILFSVHVVTWAIILLALTLYTYS